MSKTKISVKALIQAHINKFPHEAPYVANGPFFYYADRGVAEPAHLPLPESDPHHDTEAQVFFGPQPLKVHEALEAYAKHLGVLLFWAVPSPSDKRKLN